MKPEHQSQATTRRWVANAGSPRLLLAAIREH